MPDEADYGLEPPERWGRLVRGDESEPVRTERGDYPSFYSGVAAAIRGESPPPVDAADAIATLDVLEAARASAEARVVVPMDGAAPPA
jgi:predicted dehydrogenase